MPQVEILVANAVKWPIVIDVDILGQVDVILLGSTKDLLSMLDLDIYPEVYR